MSKDKNLTELNKQHLTLIRTAYRTIDDVMVVANKTYTGSFIIKENEELDNYILSLFKE